jgi:hypothetical protein
MATNNNNNNVANVNNSQPKIDPVTALQEGIGMFFNCCCVLRTPEYRYHEFEYRNSPLHYILFLFSICKDGLSLAMFEALRGLRDASTVDKENGCSSTATDSYVNTSALHQQQDLELVQKLVDAVFEKSHTIDAMLDNNHTSPNNRKTPPLYTNRTKSEQMKYIEELVNENNLVIQELYTVVQETIQQRNLCRQYIINNSEIILSPVQQCRRDDKPNNTMKDVTVNTAETEKVTQVILDK